jgi:hypothetical protein
MNLQAIAHQQLRQPVRVDFDAVALYITYVIKKTTKETK